MRAAIEDGEKKREGANALGYLAFTSAIHFTPRHSRSLFFTFRWPHPRTNTRGGSRVNVPTGVGAPCVGKGRAARLAPESRRKRVTRELVLVLDEDTKGRIVPRAVERRSENGVAEGGEGGGVEGGRGRRPRLLTWEWSSSERGEGARQGPDRARLSTIARSSACRRKAGLARATRLPSEWDEAGTFPRIRIQIGRPSPTDPFPRDPAESASRAGRVKERPKVFLLEPPVQPSIREIPRVSSVSSRIRRRTIVQARTLRTGYAFDRRRSEGQRGRGAGSLAGPPVLSTTHAGYRKYRLGSPTKGTETLYAGHAD
ncbi:hypothetical protein KM043_000581 [Ampulex compressa]|nr:hypothetical protein KM043_000581 [Ampulex compressa]